MAMSTRACGVKRMSTVNEASSGVIRQPLAKPSTSTGSPSEWPSMLACHPGLKLCPRTSQNGSPAVAPVTSAVARSWSSLRTWMAGPLGTAPAAASPTSVPLPAGVADPPAADRSTRPSTLSPESWPSALAISCSPSPSASGAPSQVASGSASPARASAMGPVTRTGTGWPSTASRSLRHPESYTAGRAGTVGAGRPISAMAAGWSTGRSLIQSWVTTGRTPAMRTRKEEPVTGWSSGRSTVAVAFCTGPSPSSGSCSVAWFTPSTISSTAVGTEWRPSAMTVSGSELMVAGAVRFTSTHSLSGLLRTVVQAVDGSPSNAADAVCRLPLSCELARAQVTDPSCGRPSVSSITYVGVRRYSRASPPRAKLRAPGRSTRRRRRCSSSWRVVSVGSWRWRVRLMASGWSAAFRPAASSRSVGTRMASSWTSGRSPTSISAKPRLDWPA